MISLLPLDRSSAFQLEHPAQKPGNSLYFSLLLGFDRRERFALDCVHRHFVF